MNFFIHALNGPVRKPWISLLLCWLFMCAFIGWRLTDQYQNIGNSERIKLIAQAKAFEEKLEASFDSVNAALLWMQKDAYLYKENYISENIFTLRMRAFEDLFPGANSFFITDSAGNVFGERGKKRLGKNISNEIFFKSVKDGNDRHRLYVSMPFVNALGKDSICLSKISLDSNGVFAGIVSVNFDLGFNNSLLKSARFDPKMWASLIHSNGEVIDFSPKKADHPIVNLRHPDTLFTRHLESGQLINLFEDIAQLTGEDSMVVLQTMTFPRVNADVHLILELGHSIENIYTGWRTGAVLSLGFFFLASITAFLLIYQVERQQKLKNEHLLELKINREKSEEDVYHLAYFDPLTNLPNRRMLMDSLNQALAVAKLNSCFGALIFIDLDYFKSLNDTHGHLMGDQLLQQVAQRLSSCVRKEDTLARLGGDEFVVMLENLNELEIEATQQAEIVGKKILLALSAPYLLDGHSHVNTCSIGITLFNALNDSLDDPLNRADMAMYQAKAAGRNNLCFFNLAIQQEALHRKSFQDRLALAISNEEFSLYFQPQVKQNGGVSGAEVLLRWHDPERGLISPTEFIPIAEDNGLILPLGRWVLYKTCLQLTEWSRKVSTSKLTLAVNVSARQLSHENFVDELIDILGQTGANPKLLKLEITESMLLNNVEDVILKMQTIKALGVSFSLDDFGTGYSSLAYLKRLPLDQLKIDQGFVRDILLDSNDAAIANMVIALANSMGLSVIAEGVETKEQRDFLESQHCCFYQGYLFSKPLPIVPFETWLESLSERA